MTESVDVLILGGGLAGCATALGLLKLQPAARVLIIERYSQAPYPIGDHLDPEGVLYWQQLSLPQLRSKLDSYGISYRWGGGRWHRHSYMKSPLGWAITLDRLALRMALTEQASRVCSFVPGARIRDLQVTSHGWSGLIERAGKNRRFEASYLVDCTGRAAAVARSLGAHRRVLWRRSSLSQSFVRAVEDCDLILEAVPQGWLSATPLPPGDRWMLSLVTERSAALEDSLGRTERIQELAVEPNGPLLVRDASMVITEPAGGKGWLSVGDAGWSLDPLTGRGMTEALFSAREASLLLADTLNGSAWWSNLRRYLESQSKRFWELARACWAAYQEHPWFSADFMRSGLVCQGGRYSNPLIASSAYDSNCGSLRSQKKRKV